MAHKDRVQMAKAIALKRLRNHARLEASVRVDMILNDIEEEFIAEFNRRVLAGEAFQLTSYQSWVVDALDQRLPPALLDTSADVGA